MNNIIVVTDPIEQEVLKNHILELLSYYRLKYYYMDSRSVVCERLQLTLNSGEDPKKLFVNGFTYNNTALHLVADSYPDIEIIESFLKLGIDINHRNSKGNTMLHLLSYKDSNLSIIPHLIEHCGANFTLKNNEGDTALHHAASWQKMRLVRYFLKIIFERHAFDMLLSKNKHGKSFLDYILPENRNAIEKYINHNKFLLFSMGQHRRIGSESPVRVLVDDVMGVIHNKL